MMQELRKFRSPRESLENGDSSGRFRRLLTMRPLHMSESFGFSATVRPFSPPRVTGENSDPLPPNSPDIKSEIQRK